MTPHADANEDEISQMSTLIDDVRRQKSALEYTSRLAFVAAIGVAFLACLILLFTVLTKFASGTLLSLELLSFGGFFVATPYFGWLLWKHRRLDLEYSRDVGAIVLLGIVLFTYSAWANGLRVVVGMMCFVVFVFMTAGVRTAIAVNLYLMGVVAVSRFFWPVDFGTYSRALLGLATIGPMLWVLRYMSHKQKATLEDSLQEMVLASARILKLTEDSQSKWKSMEEVLKSSPEGVAFLHDGRLVYANQTFTAVSGLSVDDPLPEMLMSSINAGKLQGKLEPDTTMSFPELALHGSDGELRLFSATLRPGNYRNLDVVIVWLQDITLERRAQREAELHAFTQDRIIENSPIGIGFLVDQQFQQGNEALLRTFDMQPDRPAWDLAHPEDIARVLQMSLDEWPEATEVRIRDRGGRYRPCLVKGVRIRRYGKMASVLWVVDLNDIRAAEAEAAQLRQQLVAALDSLPAMICLTDPEDRIVFANRILRDFERPFADFLVPGRTFVDFVRAVAQAKGKDEAWVARYMEKRAPGISSRELNFVKGRWLQLSREALPDGSMISIATDITDTKRAQLDMREARDAAERLARAKSDFIANMSHEIRTPMNAIIGTCYLTLQGNLDERTRKDLERVYRAARSLFVILNDILDFSALDSGKARLIPAEFRLGDLLASVSTQIGAMAREKSLDFRIDLEPSVPSVLFGDPARLKQVLMNLCDNAVKFTERGSISVHASCVEALGNEVQLRFCVRDTGIGVPPDRQENLFGDFTQIESSTSRRFGGTGIGLGIAKRVVDLMGGRIWVESVLGNGSAFFFTARLGCVTNGQGSAPSVEKIVGSFRVEPLPGTAHSASPEETVPAPEGMLAPAVRSRIIQGISQLRPLLRDGDATVLELWQPLAALVPEHENVRTISLHLENFDFEAGLAALEAWDRDLTTGGER